MERQELIRKLNAILLEESPQLREETGRFPDGEGSQRQLLRALMNLRPPLPLRRDFLVWQDELLSMEREARGVVDAMELPGGRVVLWRGDITRLRVDAIVNAANSALLGCFHPCHDCIDNVIHSAAGLQLREECNRIMAAQGYEEPVGQAKLTGAYQLPCRYILHTVGPTIRGEVTQEDCESLASCYRSCLELAVRHGLRSIAFCCISTGVFHFPNQLAAEIATETVAEFLRQNRSIERVVFDVYAEQDEGIYRKILQKRRGQFGFGQFE